MQDGIKQARLEEPGAYWMEGNDFHFTALGTSDQFACDYTMDLLIPQVPNKNMTYRHRHTLEHSDKIIPLFGTAVKAEKVVEQREGTDRTFLRTELKVPTQTPRGDDLDDNIVYMNWIKAKYDAGEPAGISYHWQYRLKHDGKLLYANLLEIAGTPSPACKECLIGPPAAGEKAMDAKSKKELEKKTPEELQEMLEEMTLELKDKQEKLEAKLKEVDDIEKERDEAVSVAERQKLETKDTADLVKRLSADQTALKTTLEEHKVKLEEMRLDNEYLRSEKKKLVDGLISLEGDVDMEAFYKTKEEAWLKKRLDKMTPKPSTSSIDPLTRYKEAQKKLEGTDPTDAEIVKNLPPNLKAMYSKLIGKEGGV